MQIREAISHLAHRYGNQSGVMAIIAGGRHLSGSRHAAQTGGGITYIHIQDYIFHLSDFVALLFFVGKRQEARTKGGSS